MIGDNIQQSVNSFKLIGRLYENNYVEIELDLNNQNEIQLLKTIDGDVLKSSIQIRDQNNNIIPNNDIRIEEDFVGFTHLFFKSPISGKVRFRIHKIKSNPLTGETIQRIQNNYTQIELSRPLNYPYTLNTLISRLKINKTSPREIVSELSNYLRKNFEYDSSPETNKNFRNGKNSLVNLFFEMGYGDCKDFNLALATILRHEFQIPVVITHGYLNNIETKGHRWLKVFHDNEWHVVDATGTVSIDSESTDNFIDYENRMNNLPATLGDFNALHQKINQINLNDPYSKTKSHTITYENGLQEETVILEEYLLRKAYLRIATELGDRYISKAFETTLMQINKRYKLPESNSGLRLWSVMNNISPNALIDNHQDHFFAYFPNEKIRNYLNTRAINNITSKNSDSAIRTSYIIMFHHFENIDELYEQRLLTHNQYLYCRIFQCFIEGRPLEDLINNPRITRLVTNEDTFYDLLLLRRNNHGNLKLDFYTYEFMSFLYECLHRENKVNYFFNALLNQLNQSELNRNQVEYYFSFLTYIAYRNPENEQYINIVKDSISFIEDTDPSIVRVGLPLWITRYNSVWNFWIATFNADIDTIENYLGNFTDAELINVLFQILRPLAFERNREIFSQHLDYFYDRLAEYCSTSDKENLKIQDLQVLLYFNRMEESNRFLELATEILPDVLENMQNKDDIDISIVDPELIHDIINMTEYGDGIILLQEFLLIANITNYEILRNYLNNDYQLINPSIETQRELMWLEIIETTLEMELDIHDSNPLETIALQNDPYFIRTTLDEFPELTEDAIHELLVLNNYAEQRNIPLSPYIQEHIEEIINNTDFSVVNISVDNIYFDLLNDENLSPQTLNSYLLTLNQILIHYNIEEEDFWQIRAIIEKFPENPNALRLLSHLAQAENNILEMFSFNIFTENFLRLNEQIPVNDRLMISSFLLIQGPLEDEEIEQSMRKSQELLNILIESIEHADLSAELIRPLRRNLIRFTNDLSHLQPYFSIFQHEYQNELEIYENIVEQTVRILHEID
ncbi:hypothetical protein BVX93_01495, partial [bacterium B13(2017)]